jgi:nickel-dependent lactate racemase
MTQPRLQLPWLDRTITLELPPSWQQAGVFEPSPLPALTEPVQAVRHSLGDPIGSRRLRDLANEDSQIAIIIDDDSRPTPVATILPAVLDELRHANVDSGSITLVTALGLHRPMQDQEIARRAGSQAMAGLHWENHDCDDLAQLVQLGTTARGTTVWINKTVAQADLIVSIGCIEPHIIASFGGGFKNLFPGVAGRQTIAHNHGLNCTPDTFNMVGQPIDRNPMRLDLEEAGRMVERPVFVVNALLNSDLELVHVVAGDPIAAHRAGAEISAQMYGAPIPAAADVVITSSHPMNQDLRQGVKALANTIRSVRPGGVLITLVRADEGVGVFGLAERRLPLGRKGLKLLSPLLLRLVPRLNMGEEDRFFLYFALQALRHATLLMYAPTIPTEVRASLPFVEFVERPQDAIAAAERQLAADAKLIVFPHGGTTYPILNPSS